jgi:regulatory protein
MARKPADVRMMNKAVHYLGRYSSSRHKLAQVLQRFADRKLTDYEPQDIRAAVEQTLNQCAKLGYIDDWQFAVKTACSQRRLGRSQAVIRQRLRQHALDDETIMQALAEADEDSIDADLQAAIRFAQRRRLGPFANRTSASHLRHDPQQWRQRDLGAMARAGFSIATVRKIIEHDDPDTIDQLLN